MLLYWPEEDCATVVLGKNLLLSEEKLRRGSDVGDGCVIRHIPAHKGKVAAVGMFCVCVRMCVRVCVCACVHVCTYCLHALNPNAICIPLTRV